MKTAVFDFDETLVCLPSGVIWSRPISFSRKIMFPFLYLFGKLSGVIVYHQKVFEWLIGSDVSRMIDRMNILPPVAGGLAFFKTLHANGYKIIVMSYTPGVFVNSWLAAYDLNAEIICPKLNISNGKVQNISDDSVTQIYLKYPKSAKMKILADLDIKPHICVGDNRRRDAVCDKFIDIRKLEPRYKSRVLRCLENSNIIYQKNPPIFRFNDSTSFDALRRDKYHIVV
jgi:phosphoserine phosphatase